jgi:DNA-binding MarR family transcriptional regulator
MKERREKMRELSSLWNGVMNRYRALSDRITGREIQTLSETEIAIIKIIDRNDRTVVGDITKSLILPKSTVTGLIARLERKEFIRRLIYPDDLRSFALELTERGNRTIREYEKHEEEIFEKLIEPLSDGQSKALIELLRSMVSQRRV